MKRIIRRERASGSYRSSSAYVAKMLSSLPLMLLGNAIIAIPTYWAVGLAPTAGQFFTYIAIIVIHSICAANLGLAISAAVPNPQLIIIVFMLFSGLLINLETITVVLRWIQWVSLIAYTYKAFGQNEFTESLKFTCTPGQQCYATGADVVSAFSLGNPELWACVAINAAFAVFYCLLGMMIFNRTSAPLQKLK
ncbi:ATP-binding cassette sub- G member 2 [Kappamyces sp. JEL0680]|nr:ATP-binding cassette sub- G member 2 [Kappamyces sp. JEL0680]